MLIFILAILPLLFWGSLIISTRFLPAFNEFFGIDMPIIFFLLIVAAILLSIMFLLFWSLVLFSELSDAHKNTPNQDEKDNKNDSIDNENEYRIMTIEEVFKDVHYCCDNSSEIHHNPQEE